MKKLLLTCISLFVLSTSVFHTISFCQEVEGTDFTYGIIVHISSDSITLREFNVDTDKEEVIDYYVSPYAKLENVDSFEEIKTEDEIGIEYIEDNKEKTITYIYLYRND